MTSTLADFQRKVTGTGSTVVQNTFSPFQGVAVTPEPCFIVSQSTARQGTWSGSPPIGWSNFDGIYTNTTLLPASDTFTSKYTLDNPTEGEEVTFGLEVWGPMAEPQTFSTPSMTDRHIGITPDGTVFLAGLASGVVKLYRDGTEVQIPTHNATEMKYVCGVSNNTAILAWVNNTTLGFVRITIGETVDEVNVPSLGVAAAAYSQNTLCYNNSEQGIFFSYIDNSRIRAQILDVNALTWSDIGTAPLLAGIGPYGANTEFVPNAVHATCTQLDGCLFAYSGTAQLNQFTSQPNNYILLILRGGFTYLQYFQSSTQVTMCAGSGDTIFLGYINQSSAYQIDRYNPEVGWTTLFNVNSSFTPLGVSFNEPFMYFQSGFYCNWTTSPDLFAVPGMTGAITMNTNNSLQPYYATSSGTARVYGKTVASKIVKWTANTPTPTPTPTPDPTVSPSPGDEDGGSNVSLILWIVFGILAVLALIFGLVFGLKRRKKKKN